MNLPPKVMTDLASHGRKSRDLTVLADTKAQTLASGLVPSIAASVAAGAFADLHGPAAVTGATAAFVAALAVALLGVVLWPRTDPTARPSTPAQLIESLTNKTTDVNSAAAEAFRIERIAALKFRWLRTAMALTGVAGLLALATVLLAVTA
ncbi:hypothetical protein [Glycomyces artemisiae]|uniref:Pycsar effector protein domain-containing protein n=1 Tax=Glycomyces artemisiae TaxID=1076443 RepID=A0A2T0UI10_9ACTN|nr:hypothetical protein [Glycomyces artemisiae]PRY57581.1 hypothetical protein B0I28_1061 [Glycomyces artemisiae]